MRKLVTTSRQLMSFAYIDLIIMLYIGFAHFLLYHIKLYVSLIVCSINEMSSSLAESAYLY